MIFVPGLLIDPCMLTHYDWAASMHIHFFIINNAGGTAYDLYHEWALIFYAGHPLTMRITQYV